jgi:hypothetical protein
MNSSHSQALTCTGFDFSNIDQHDLTTTRDILQAALAYSNKGEAFTPFQSVGSLPTVGSRSILRTEYKTLYFSRRNPCASLG